jgi:enterochelin esterase family protein
MVIHELESKILDKKHGVHVYLPAGYEAGSDAHPVAYYHGGAGAQARGPFPQALDNLIGTSIAPVIVVFIQELPPAFGPPAPYAQMVMTELVPFIDSTYRTIPSAEGRASLGNGTLGFPAFLCALMQPGVFGKVATQGAWLYDFAVGPLTGMMKTPVEQPLDIYMDWGRYDLGNPQENWNWGDNNRNFTKLLEGKGYKPKGGEAADGTGWSSWGNRTGAVFQALFPAVD